MIAKRISEETDKHEMAWTIPDARMNEFVQHNPSRPPRNEPISLNKRAQTRDPARTGSRHQHGHVDADATATVTLVLKFAKR